jgi:hypothetical protein
MDELKTPRSHGPGPSQSSVHRWGHLFRHHRIPCVQAWQEIRAFRADLVRCRVDAVPLRVSETWLMWVIGAVLCSWVYYQ